MDFLFNTFQFFFEIDQHLGVVLQHYHMYFYYIIFGIIFSETGFVIFPFLPGDSLLFTAGALSVSKHLNVVTMILVVTAAAFLGNTTNYFIGYLLSSFMLNKNHEWLIKKEHIDKAHKFYEKYGSWAITLSRFFPILRTITPFIAGIAKMNFLKFSFYNFLGGFSWSVIFILSGYFFGKIPFIKEQLVFLVLLVLLLTLIPIIWAYFNYLNKPKTPNKI